MCWDGQLHIRILGSSTLQQLVSSSNFKWPETPLDYRCPLTIETMCDPVVASDGHTYERTAIQKILDTNCISPMTREILLPHVFPNVALRNRIHDSFNEIVDIVEKTALACE